MFAATVRAEAGWKVLLVRKDGTPSLIDIKKWGSTTSSWANTAPLDYIGEDLSKRENFVMTLNPNYPMTKEQIAKTAARRARELHWIA